MKAIVIITICILFIHCHNIFLQLPFDVDWRVSSSCLKEDLIKVEESFTESFAVEEVLRLRECIQTNGAHKMELSYKEPFLCAHDESSYTLDEAFEFSKGFGFSNSFCIKYENNKCLYDYDCLAKKPTKLLAKEINRIEKEGMVMQEILLNGPVLATFDVYSDFIDYKRGVYSHLQGDLIRKSSFVVVGYSTHNNINYWIGKGVNGKDWGEEGYFKYEFNDKIKFFSINPKVIN